MNYELTTEEVASTLCLAAKMNSNEYKEVESAIYHLKCVCDNEMNDEKFRTLYRCLVAIATKSISE